MKWQTRKLTSNQVGLKYGFRSGLEIAISEELDLNKIQYEFEKVKLKYSVPEYIKSDLDLSKHIVSISNADKIDGGDGAIIIKLKKL